MKLSFINIWLIYFILFYNVLIYYFIILASSDFQRFIIRKIIDIGFQLRSLQEQGNVMNSRLDTILQNLQISPSHGTEGETIEQHVMNNFPIDNMEDLQTFEKSLIENQINRQKLVSAVKIGINCVCVCARAYFYVYFYIFLQIKELSRIGGNDIRRIIFNLLRTLLSDKLACMFNYIGGKKKQIFYDLEIQKVIFSKYIIISSFLIIILIYK